MPLLVGKLDMTGKILTADAMSTQKDIIDCIRKKGGGLPDRTHGSPAGAVLRGGGRTQKENAAAFLHGRSGFGARKNRDNSTERSPEASQLQ